MTTPENDIRALVAKLTTPEDLDLLAVVADERRARLAELAELRKRFEDEAATFGLTAEAVINGPAKKTRRGRPRKIQSVLPEE